MSTVNPLFVGAATPTCRNLSGLTLVAKDAVPARLGELTVEVRACIGEQGWRSNLAEWRDGPTSGFRLYTRSAGETAENAAWDDIQQNYLSFPDVAGACDVLEAEVALESHNPHWTRLRVGVPASRIGKGRSHHIILRFNGSSLSLFVDGVRVDEDWPVGQIPAAVAPVWIGDDRFDGRIESVTVWSCALSDDDIVRRAGGVEQVARREAEILGPERSCVQYWTPRGHNQWFGDVLMGDTSAFGDGRFRLFYLTDRRHGASKFGCGGHSIAQMSSMDLVRWEQHPVAFELEPWETVGTGRPLVLRDKLLLLYGMHTSRIMPKDSLAIPAIDGDGCTVPEPFASGAPYPQGTSFATSTDGIAFECSRRLVHPAQNPAICRDEAGNGFLLMAGYGSKGLWHSEDMEHWQLVDQEIIPTNQDSPTRNTDECQCMFAWNGWHYILGGRTGYWMSRQQRGPYWAGKDGRNAAAVVKPRWDLYDGLWVPMVAPFGNNRRILAGFLQGPEFEWAGHLVLRELVQCADGTLGTKWPEEVVPPVCRWLEPRFRQRDRLVAGATLAVDGSAASWGGVDAVPASARLSFRIERSRGTSHVGVAVCGEEGNGCALSVLAPAGRIQWNGVQKGQLPCEVPTLAQVLSHDPTPIWQMQNPHVPFAGRDFAITHVEGLDHPVLIELLMVYDPKSRSTILDACINGQRTLVTRRKGLIAREIQWFADGPCEFCDLRLGSLG